MSDLGWRADGIERALAAGGVEIEIYRRPGFTGGQAVRRVPINRWGGSGFEVQADPDASEFANRRLGARGDRS